MDRQLTGDDYVTSKEVRMLREAARKTRDALRNELMILMMYRHGLRVSEAVNTEKKHIDQETARFEVIRLKSSNYSVHQLYPDELKLLRRYDKFKERKQINFSPFLFVSGTGARLTKYAPYKIVRLLASNAGLTKPVHPHMLRHGCGFYLANEGYSLRVIQDYLGHKEISNTVRYTRLLSSQFEGLWAKEVRS